MDLRSLPIFLLIAGPIWAAEPSWQDQLDSMNKQIQSLSEQIDSYRHKALDAESAAQNQMQSNFPLYVQDIKESEKNEELSRNAEKQMKILQQQRDDFIQAHAKESPSGSK